LQIQSCEVVSYQKFCRSFEIPNGGRVLARLSVRVYGGLLLKLCVQISSEVCRAFNLCRQGRCAELLTQYKSSPCPPLPVVQRDKHQTSAANDDDDSSDNELDSSQVRCAAACFIVNYLNLNNVYSVRLSFCLIGLFIPWIVVLYCLVLFSVKMLEIRNVRSYLNFFIVHSV